MIGEGDSSRRFGLGKILRGVTSFRKKAESVSSEPKEQEVPKRYGIKLRDLTPDVFIGIIAVYDSVAGTDRVSEYQTFPDRVIYDLNEITSEITGGVFHRMFGSNLSPGSKLSMRSGGSIEGEKIVKISFEVQENGEGTKEGLEMERRFRNGVEKYLLEKNLAVELEYPHSLG